MNANHRNRHRSRLGAATVEFAVCLPVIVLLVFGGIQSASMLFLRQTLVQASYEGIKTAVTNNGNLADAEAAARAVTDGRNLEGVSVTFDPSDIESLERGGIVRVTVSAPGDNNSLFPFGPFAGKNVSASAAFVKE